MELFLWQIKITALEHYVFVLSGGDGSPYSAEVAMQILLAEDNPNNEQVARLLLAELGHTTRSARNGLEVLEILRSGERFDLILMDIQMPKMDGLETTRRIMREFPEESRPPIIAATANAFESDREECFVAGMVGFLAKPLRLADLRDALAAMATGETVPASPANEPACDHDLDLEHFDSIMESGDEESREIFEDFCAATEVMLGEMQEHFGVGEAKQFTNLAHQLKGSLATFGMARLSRRMAELEDGAATGSLDGLAPDWSEGLLDAFRAAAKKLRSRL